MNVLASVKMSELLVQAGIFVGVVVVAGAVLLWFRHRCLGPAGPDEAANFDLAALEKLRAAGEISDEEFRRLRRLALGLPDADPPAAPAEPSDGGGSAEAAKPAEAEELAESPEPADPPEKPSGSLTPDGEVDDA